MFNFIFRKQSTAFMVGCYFCSLFISLNPIISGDNYALPFRNIWIPLNYESKTYYRFTYLYHVTCLLLSTIMTYGCDTYFNQFVEKICAELDVLKYRLHSLSNRTDKCYKLKGNQCELTTMKDWLHFHLHLFKYVWILVKNSYFCKKFSL